MFVLAHGAKFAPYRVSGKNRIYDTAKYDTADGLTCQKRNFSESARCSVKRNFYKCVKDDLCDTTNDSACQPSKTELLQQMIQEQSHEKRPYAFDDCGRKYPYHISAEKVG